MDYLTKRPDVFPVTDQSAATIARLLVEEIISHHGVPTEVLSDRGRSFLSALMKTLLGFHKVNTSAYNPQTDRLFERYNQTLTAMLAKTAQDSGCDWDRRLPYVLFAFRACRQESTRESLFFLMYGREPKLPTPAVLNPKKTRATMDLRAEFVDAVREGDGNRVIPCWRFLLPLFKSASRVHYSKEALNLLCQLIVLSPRQASQITWSRFVNAYGWAGHNISCDPHREHLNRVVKTAVTNLGANLTPKAIVRVGKCLGPIIKATKQFDTKTNVQGRRKGS